MAAFTFSNHTIAGGTDSTTITSAGISTIGANFAAVITTWLASGTTPAVSDSQTSSWSNCPTYTVAGTNASIRISYANLAGTNASHTFQAQGTNSFPALAVITFSASGIVTLDQSNGSATAGASSSTVQPGSITPSTNNQLVIFGAQGDHSVASGGSVSAPYVLRDEEDYTGFILFTGLAYVIQTTATATNPTWTFGSSQPNTGAAIASFQAAAGATMGYLKQNRVRPAMFRPGLAR